MLYIINFFKKNFIELNKVINVLKDEGHTYRSIAQLCNISKSKVHNVIFKKWKIFKKKTGPKPKINKRLSTRISRFVAFKNLNGQKVNCNKIINELDLDVKRRTLNDWLKKKDYKYSKCSQKISLGKKHKSKRLEISKQWLDENINWNNVAFTDEKSFSLDGPDNW